MSNHDCEQRDHGDAPPAMMWPCCSLPARSNWPGTVCGLFSGVMGGGSLSMPASFLDACESQVGQSVRLAIQQQDARPSANLPRQSRRIHGATGLSRGVHLKWASRIHSNCFRAATRGKLSPYDTHTCFASLGSSLGQSSKPSAIWSNPASRR